MLIPLVFAVVFMTALCVVTTFRILTLKSQRDSFHDGCISWKETYHEKCKNFNELLEENSKNLSALASTRTLLTKREEVIAGKENLIKECCSVMSCAESRISSLKSSNAKLNQELSETHDRLQDAEEKLEEFEVAFREIMGFTNSVCKGIVKDEECEGCPDISLDQLAFEQEYREADSVASELELAIAQALGIPVKIEVAE